MNALSRITTMYTRREILHGLTVGAVALIGGCKSRSKMPSSCKDVTGLTDAQKTVRKELGYVDRTTNAKQTCANCSLYVKPAQPDRCGGCEIMKGPIHPLGTCDSWQAIEK